MSLNKVGRRPWAARAAQLTDELVRQLTSRCVNRVGVGFTRQGDQNNARHMWQLRLMADISVTFAAVRLFSLNVICWRWKQWKKGGGGETRAGGLSRRPVSALAVAALRHLVWSSSPFHTWFEENYVWNHVFVFFVVFFEEKRGWRRQCCLARDRSVLSVLHEEDEDLLCVKLVSGWESVGLTLTSELGS